MRKRARHVVGDGEEGGDERAERVQVRERRGPGAVERIQQHLAPSAARGIHQIRNVPGGDPRRAVDLLEVDLIVQGTRDLLHVNSRGYCLGSFIGYSIVASFF